MLGHNSESRIASDNILRFFLEIDDFIDSTNWMQMILIITQIDD